jgi:hypothetical protein
LNGNFNELDPPPIAITVNLTVTLTRQKGWLALYPGDEAFPGTSSINWFGDFQDLANSAYVAINDASSLKLTCGGIRGRAGRLHPRPHRCHRGHRLQCGLGRRRDRGVPHTLDRSLSHADTRRNR